MRLSPPPKAAVLARKVLPVNYAFHSPQMEPFGAEMAESGLRSDNADRIGSGLFDRDGGAGYR